MAKKDDVVGRITFGPAKTDPTVPVSKEIRLRPATAEKASTGESLMSRGDGGFPVSRDFSMGTVECAVSDCPANDSVGMCIMPACIKIGADGRCLLASQRKLGKTEDVKEGD